MPAMPFSPCPSGGSCPDVAVGILRRIFGPVIDALASVTLAQMLETLE